MPEVLGREDMAKHHRVVCTENFIRIDPAIESPNVGDDGRAVMLLGDAVRLAAQVEGPT